ncbi:MAG: tetratricopeptide repeat protein [Fimbriimonadaceae bacterium]|nr:MAG: tetratricopeptide repeat protein [Fimbriimonadaceae bacterium]
MNRFLRKTADRSARDLTKGFELRSAGSSFATELQAALGHQREHRHHMAEPIYEKILAHDPENLDALYLLSTVKLGHQEYDEAVQLLKHLTMAHPQFAEAWSSYGSALTGLGELEEAMAAFHRALDINPSLSDTHYHLAQLHFALKEWRSAAEHFRLAVGYDPSHAQAYNELAICFYHMHEFDQSMAACHSALLIDKGFVPAYNSLGLALAALGQSHSAEEAYRTAIRLNPRYAEAYGNLGKTFLELGKPAQALEACIQATQIDDNLSVAYCTRGEALRRLGRLDEAMQSCHRALGIDPNMSDAHNCIGLIYLDSSMVDESVQAFSQALVLDPNNRQSASNIVQSMGCSLMAGPELVKQAAQNWSKRFAFGQPPRSPKPPQIRRLGFLVGKIEDTPQGYWLEALLSGRDTDRCQVYVYSSEASDGKQSERISELTDKFRPMVGLDDLTVSTIIREDHIDALVDLTGHGANGRLGVLVHHAAPIQVACATAGSTLGLESVSTFLADKEVVPQGGETWLTEKVLRLSRSIYGFVQPELETPLSAPPCTKGEPFTFGSFNQTRKLNKLVIEVWADILRATPGSRLLIKNRTLASGSLRRQYLAWFKNLGIDTDRIIFRQAGGRTAHFASFNQVDVSLDPFPSSGSITIMESLWMGVPVISLNQAGLGAGSSRSILQAVGYQQWIARDRNAYVEQAVSFFNNHQELEDLRCSLRNRMILSPICETKELFRELVDALEDYA